MAEDKLEGREVSWRQLLPWTELFRGFQIALDLNKLLLAAAGIFVMAGGWSLLAVVFTAGYSEPPSWPGSYESKFPAVEGTPDRAAWVEFKKHRDQWNLMHEAAGFGGLRRWDIADLAESSEEWKLVKENLGDRPAGEALDRLVKEKKLSEVRA